MNCLLCLVFVSIVSTGIAQNCPYEPVSSANVKFTLFTSKDNKVGINLNEATYKNVNAKVVTTIIIHGFTQHLIKPWVPLMKDAYLKKSTANIITVDWTAYTTGTDRTKAVCATRRGVGRYVGDLIYNLTKVGVDAGKVQMNGFGMGAHVAGIAGQRVIELTKSKVCRINGLSAPREGFFGKPAEERLDASDAKFVQAIHTNNGGVGMSDNYGTIDFQVNYNSDNDTCGSSQPGCPKNSGIPNEGASAEPFCNVLRAATYFIESIDSNKFLGVQCCNNLCSNFGKGKCNSDSKTIMGEMCPNDQKGVRFLNTNAKSPFAQG